MNTFLVIEDNEDDALLIKRAFSMTGSCQAVLRRNMGEAKAYLQRAGVYSDREKYPFPNAVISDLHLGLDSAVDFLHWIRASEELRSMGVVVLSGTASAREGALVKDLGGLDILKKPATYEDLKSMVQDMVSKLCG
ncbi:MAG TPA: hypothetical protein VM680_16770 [Verrucomicrobiae bacterium]|nr:hypothetical protein [Verrucomicrobiae bacterium]